MDMPKPTDAHRRLVDAMAGSWRGEETMHPSPWSPTGGVAESRIDARAALDGFHVVSDYVQIRDGAETFRGHGVYGWDARRERYTMYWFDSMGFDPGGPSLGRFDADVLTFESPNGKSRYVYTFRDGGYDFRIESSRDGAAWETLLDSTYRRA